MSIYKHNVYFAADLNNPGEVGKWKNQKRAKKGKKANSTYRKNWSAFLEKNAQLKQATPAKPRKLFRITKDGYRIPADLKSVDPEDEGIGIIKSIMA